MVRVTSFLAAAAALAPGISVVAHPGETHSHEDIAREIAVRDKVAALGQRSLASCSNSASVQRMKARNIERRANKLQELRRKRGIKTSESIWSPFLRA